MMPMIVSGWRVAARVSATERVRAPARGGPVSERGSPEIGPIVRVPKSGPKRARSRSSSRVRSSRAVAGEPRSASSAVAGRMLPGGGGVRCGRGFAGGRDTIPVCPRVSIVASRPARGPPGRWSPAPGEAELLSCGGEPDGARRSARPRHLNPPRRREVLHRPVGAGVARLQPAARGADRGGLARRQRQDLRAQPPGRPGRAASFRGRGPAATRDRRPRRPSPPHPPDQAATPSGASWGRARSAVWPAATAGPPRAGRTGGACRAARSAAAPPASGRPCRTGARPGPGRRRRAPGCRLGPWPDAGRDRAGPQEPRAAPASSTRRRPAQHDADQPRIVAQARPRGHEQRLGADGRAGRLDPQGNPEAAPGGILRRRGVQRCRRRHGALIGARRTCA